MKILRVPLSILAIATTAGCSGFDFDWLDRNSPNKDRRDSTYLREYSFAPDNVAEPTIDIVQVAAGEEIAVAPAPPRVGVGVKTAGGPAPDTAYSNFVELRVTYVDLPGWRLSILKQRHDGVDSTEIEAVGGAEDDVDTAEASVIEMPWGFFFEFPLPEDIERDLTIFEIFMGFLEVDGGTFLDDETGEIEHDETEPVEDILSEIEEVFVPA